MLLLPSAVYIASLSIKALDTLASWNIIKLVSSAYSFWILPLAGSADLVIDSATENTFVSFIPVLLLNIPEYMRELLLKDALGSSSTK